MNKTPQATLDSHKEWRLANPEKCRVWHRRWRENNPAYNKEYQRKWYKLYKDRHRKARKRYAAKVRYQVIMKYGGACACCGEENYGFLTMGHINGDGKEERAKIGGGMRWLLRLRKSPLRKYLRVECWNCNLGSWRNGGVCPHVKARKLPSSDR